MAKKLVFVSNYFNHHQEALAREFLNIYGDDYIFIARTPFNQKRLAIGYADMNQEPFVLRAYESQQAMTEAKRLILEAEYVVAVGVNVSVLSERLKAGHISFMQSEPFLKGPMWRDAVRILKYYHYSGCRHEASNPESKFYLLCTGTPARDNYRLCGLFRNKAYKWGYFPATKHYDNLEALLSSKEKGSILWTGRFLDWKHPDLAVTLAKNLKAMNLDFRIKIIGSGPMQETLSRMIDDMNLRECVELKGALPVSEIRAEMEKSQIFLFTSDRGEGWGVVLNETMNSACAVIASDKAGSSTYLVRHGQNGLIFRDRDAGSLTECAASLLREPGEISRLGREAYNTIAGEWNAHVAAKRFIELARALRASKGEVSLYDDGPLSIA